MAGYFVTSDNPGFIDHLLQYIPTRPGEILTTEIFHSESNPKRYGIYRSGERAHGFLAINEVRHRIDYETPESFNQLLQYIRALKDF